MAVCRLKPLLLVCAAQRLTIGALLPTLPHHPALYHMLRSTAAIFEEDINRNGQILPGTKVSVLSASSGYASPHTALGAVTKLYSEAEGTLVGWVGPWSNMACPPTQDLIRGLGQPQISYGCTQTAMSSKARFPVRFL